MSFFSRLGSKISHAANSIGKKAAGIAKKGVKVVADNASNAVRHGGQAIDKLRRGNVSGAIQSGVVAAKFGSAAAGRAGTTRKEIQRLK